MQTNGDKYATRRIGHSRLGHRYTVPEAAEALGVTVDAIRSRIKRHTIMHVRESGRVYVLLDDDQGITSHDQGTAQDTAHHDDHPPETGPEHRAAHRDELLEELRDRVRALEESNREHRRIILALTSRLPALEASETPPEPPDSPPPRSDTVGAQEGAQGQSANVERPTEETARRPWWVRWFGG